MKIIPYLIDRVVVLDNGILGVDVLYRERDEAHRGGGGKLSRNVIHHQLFYEIEGVKSSDEAGIRTAVEQRLREDGF